MTCDMPSPWHNDRSPLLVTAKKAGRKLKSHRGYLENKDWHSRRTAINRKKRKELQP